MGKPRIGIFLRLDEETGLGHWGRCLPLARELAQAGLRCLILAPGPSPYLDRARAAGFEVKLCPAWDGPGFAEAARRLRLRGAVLDFHGIRREQVYALRDLGLVLLALAVQDGELDGVQLLANPTALPLAGVQVLAGAGAALLDEAGLAPLVARVRPQEGAVTLALGGSQLAADATPGLAAALAGCPGLRRLDVFLARPESLPRRHLVRAHGLDRTRFLHRLIHSSLLLCGYGTSLFEAARLGVPALVWPLSEQQARHAARLHGEGFFQLLDPGPDFAVALVQPVERLLIDEHRRASLANAARRALDGSAARRVAAAFLAYLGPRPRLDSSP